MENEGKIKFPLPAEMRDTRQWLNKTQNHTAQIYEEQIAISKVQLKYIPFAKSSCFILSAGIDS